MDERNLWLLWRKGNSSGSQRRRIWSDYFEDDEENEAELEEANCID